MFDLTKEVVLDKKNNKLYKKLQVFIYLAAFFSAFYLAYLIIFPHKYFYFSFKNPSSSENNMVEPYLASKENIVSGKIPKGESLFFDSNVLDRYSELSLNFKLLTNSNDVSGTTYLRKSYKSFLYDEREPIGFKNGTLLKNNDAYYIVSDGKLKKFKSSDILTSFGYSKKQFQEVPESDLRYNTGGEDIEKIEPYPNDTLFQIDDNFYIMKNQTLEKFVSDKAYFSNYDASQAIKKDSAFLNNHPISDNLVGFSDGTLVSNDISVYIVSKGKIYPIDSPETFESNGFLWDDVLPIGSDELAIYKKEKIFNIKSPHPDGTIFKTTEDSSYYMINNGQKHLLPSENIASSWLKKNPISVSKESLGRKAYCTIEKKLSQSNIYICKITLDKMTNFSGFDYQFNASFDKDVFLDSVDINFKRNIDIENLKDFIEKNFNRIKQNYVPTSTN